MELFACDQFESRQRKKKHAFLRHPGASKHAKGLPWHLQKPFVYFRLWNNLKTAVLQSERRQMAPRLPDGPETAYKDGPEIAQGDPKTAYEYGTKPTYKMAPRLPRGPEIAREQCTKPAYKTAPRLHNCPGTAYEMAPATICNCPETACIWPQDCRMAQRRP